MVANEVMTKAPETATTALGAEIFNLRTELSSYDASVRAKINELYASCKSSLTALQMVHQEAALELNNLQAALNESNSKVAARFIEIAKAVADLEANTQQTAPPTAAPKEAPTASVGPRFIDPVTGKLNEADASAPPSRPEQFFMGSPANGQEVPGPDSAPMREPPGYGRQQPQQDWSQQDWSQTQQQPFRTQPGAINITAYSKLFWGEGRLNERAVWWCQRQ